MKVSMNWLKKYAPIDVDATTYENRMIMTGTAVEGVDDLNELFHNVVVGKVLSVIDHENSDHLHVCQVDVGDEVLQIVCGAPNVKEGILVPVAKIGAVLPGDFRIKKGKLRGVQSDGMLCSSTEICVPVELYPSVGDAGLLVFQEDYPLGTDVKEIFGFNDHVIDFEILANRPDCLSVWGVARETAAAFDVELNIPSIEVKETPDTDIHTMAKVDVESALCSRYTARVVKNIRLAPSPLWLRQHLNAAGVRSINNIVDITNYVMLETGTPMHAFDLAKVKNQHIIVRTANNGETLTTLDGKTHTMQGGELLICDESGATGLAGVMGGEESEITNTTTDILFEAACFDRASVRQTARSLGIRTESSGRFERGVHANCVLDSLNRACQMINELDAGDVVQGIIDIYPSPIAPVTLTCSVEKICTRAGVVVTGDEMVRILKKLQFTACVDGDVLTVTAPSFRQDISTDADICEEVLRYAGYDRIPSTPLKGVAQGGVNPSMAEENTMRSLLCGLGYYETMTFSFLAQKKLEQLNLTKGDRRLSPLCLLNPLGEDTAVMRTTLLCGVLDTVSQNIAHGNLEGKIFELGKVFDGQNKTEEKLPVQDRALCFATWGGASDFYSLRSTVETLFARIGIVANIAQSDEQTFHPGRRATLEMEGKPLATLGELHPVVMKHYGINKRVYVAHIDMETVFQFACVMGHVQAPAKFPLVSRDLALVMKDSQPVGPVMQKMQEACGKMLEKITMFDVFRGIQVGEGNKSVAFSLAFRASDHTLTEEEIAPLMQKVLKVVKETFDADIRS